MVNRHLITRYLITQGQAALSTSRAAVEFTDAAEINAVLNDIERYPHLFILGSLMDKGVGRKKAWEIPYRIRDKFALPGFDLGYYRDLTRVQIERAFIQDTLHRYPSKMARLFADAVAFIAERYGGDAARIWSGRPHSATLVKRLLEFKGMGMKNAMLAAHDLYRDFKVELADRTNLDVTPDGYVKRVFRRMGFTGQHPSNDQLVYLARDLHPPYPGVFDRPAFDMATRVCRASKPECHRCELKPFCPKYP